MVHRARQNAASLAVPRSTWPTSRAADSTPTSNRALVLWDVAAGWILVETAGGSVEMKPRTDMPDRYSIIASNGVIDLKL